MLAFRLMQTGWDVLRALSAAVALALGVAACTGGSSPHTGATGSTSPSAGGGPAPSVTTSAGRATASSGTVPTALVSSATPSTAAPELPVAGSFVYHGGRSGDVVVRIAVHALRRVAQGTVLDWSITPLSAPGLSGDDAVQLGTADLGSFYGYHAISLADTAAHKLYRPLLDGAVVNAHCVCAAYLGGSTDLHLAKTALFQLVFPPLPSALAAVDVMDQGFVVPGVPVTPEGQLPTVGQPVDLTAPPTAGPGTPAADGQQSAAFDYPQGPNVVNVSGKKQPMNVTVDGLYGYPGGTMLVWTVTSRAAGAGLNTGGGLPVADYDLHVNGTGDKPTVADGPGLLPAGVDPRTGTTLRSDYATLRAKTAAPPSAKTAHWQQCLCSDWQERETALSASGGSLTLATTFPALPAGGTASVTFPGSTVPALTGVPVTPMAPSTSGPPQPVALTTWHADEKRQLQRSFRPDQWPTPVPDAASYDGFGTVVIDDMIDKTTTPATRSDTQNHVTNLTLDSTVLFSLNSAKLLPAASGELGRIAADLNSSAKAGSTVAIAGYVSANDGQTVQAGQALSTARAQAVYDALKGRVTKGVHWTVVGKGAADPVVPNDNETDRRLNRRVTITYDR
ncbi:MAG: hypothetical protein QOF39_2885 [Frankiales bacterium]|nr:hypothetical protein [Frankiales bacterium]